MVESLPKSMVNAVGAGASFSGGVWAGGVIFSEGLVFSVTLAGGCFGVYRHRERISPYKWWHTEDHYSTFHLSGH